MHLAGRVVHRRLFADVTDPAEHEPWTLNFEPDYTAAALEMLNACVAASHAPECAVIEGIDWTVRVGDFWVVGGSSGSGKSDLMATAAGLLRPLRGVHRLFGEELIRLDEESFLRQRRRAGLVFGNEGRLFNQMTVAENLALPLCYHRNCDAREVRARVDEILEHTGLSAMANRTPANVNRSLRSRVALARALALQPELLLLDNPVRESDPAQRRWWIEFLSVLCAGHAVLSHRRTTIVVATDDFRPWLGAGQRFALITGQGWRTIGARADLSACDEPLLRELLHEETSETRG
jgi:ABC-type transporter Mla maintaining outer membrane lipid asymmetry ATPase subunit MlaF